MKNIAVKRRFLLIVVDLEQILFLADLGESVFFARRTKSNHIRCKFFSISRCREFKRAVASNVIVQYRTEATRCNVCNGYGRVSRKRKDGTWGKARYICKSCDGVGIKYMPTNEVAGFKLAPISVMSCSTQGFKTDADALSLYRE